MFLFDLNCDVMRRFLYIICTALLTLAAGRADAQNIPIGRRAPDVKPQSWLHGVRPVRDAKLTCIEFYHPASARSRANIDSLILLTREVLRKDFQVIVVAAGDETVVERQLAVCTEEGVPVGLDPENQCFKALGVTYLPACIIVDDRQKILWTGDSRTLTPQIIGNLK